MHNKNLPKFITIVMLIAVLSAAGSLPFYFESPSIFYKTGLDKIMLRAGKILGIITAVLLLIQLVLISRFPVLDKLWGPKQLFHFHRTNGLILLSFAVAHPVLILGADHFVFFPFEPKYWPEFIGILLLLILTIFVGISHWQKNIGIQYKTWRLFHKLVAPLIFLLMGVHVYHVSRTFESGVPLYALGLGAVTAVCLVIQKYLK
jgi:predicted ferric reductase